jgi:hypothetical protein
MAYAFSVTVNRLGNDTQILISETDVSAGDEATVVGIPLHGTILRQKCSVTAGPATTVNPVLYRVAGGGPNATLAANATPAQAVDNASPQFAYSDPDGSAFHRSQPDAGATNAIESEYLIKGGW